MCVCVCVCVCVDHHDFVNVNGSHDSICLIMADAHWTLTGQWEESCKRVTYINKTEIHNDLKHQTDSFIKEFLHSEASFVDANYTLTLKRPRFTNYICCCTTNKRFS